MQPIEHIQIAGRLKPQTVANLKTLANKLTRVPKSRFSMGSFTDFRGASGFFDKPVSVNECGTCACAAGHAFAMGIGDTKNPKSWEQYTQRNLTDGDPIVFEWCFGGAWSTCDDTPLGAAKRILYMLKFGIPNQTDMDVSDLIVEIERAYDIPDEFISTAVYKRLTVKALTETA